MTKILPLDDLPGLASATEADASSEFSEIAGGVITIGNFDGVHQGHAMLLGQVRELADERGCPAVAVVLDPHPVTILRPDLVYRRLTRIERRAALMHEHGIDALVVCKTTSRFLQLTASEFFDSLVVGCLKASAMFEGPNFFFGRDRGGDVAVLQELCDRNGVDLRIVEPTCEGAEMVSSTRIRRLLETGNVEKANSMLGHPYLIRGTVTTGAKRGREIGFPTANLVDMDVVVPAPGVYGGFATVEGMDVAQVAAIHIGPNPTFEQDGESKVEIHLLGYDGDLYGQQLQVDFVTRVRNIMRFGSANELIEQLHKDIQTIRERLAGGPSRG
ncbi:MAG: bifunctional riboflavin kinase/FAD synthetase [Rubripirellula sp.]